MSNVQRQAIGDLANNFDVVYGIHVVSAVLYFLAAIPNAYLLILILRKKTLHTVFNWAVCNLMFSNLLRVLSAAIYCSVKAAQFTSGVPHPDMLNTKNNCFSLVGFTLFFRYGPVWSLSLLAFVLAIEYGPNKWIRKSFTLFRMMEVRVAMWLIDLAHTCFMLSEFSRQNLDGKTQCTWQIMVIGSKPYELYHWVLIHLLVVLGITAGCLKFYQSEPVEKSEPVSKKLRIKRISLLIGCSITVAMFLLPKFAYVRYTFAFWIGSETICPAVMAIIMPVLFTAAFPSLQNACYDDIHCVKSGIENSHKNGGIQRKNSDEPDTIEQRTESTATMLPWQENEATVSDSTGGAHENPGFQNDQEPKTNEEGVENRRRKSIETVAEVHQVPVFST